MLLRRGLGRNVSASQGYYAHPTAIVESQDIGEGTKIWHFAHIRCGAKIGDSASGAARSAAPMRSARERERTERVMGVPPDRFGG